MDISDSATAEARKNRNQKKYESILNQQEQDSLNVEPREIVYFPSSTVEKSRTISGRVESNSPTIDEIPPPPRPKGPLV